MDAKDTGVSHIPDKEVAYSAEKEAAYDPANEKEPHYTPTAEHIADTGARRESVAHNIIENPLTRQSKAECVSAAERWAATHGLDEHAALFGKAALIARDPERFEMLTDLTQEERDALIYERDHKWFGPTMMWYSIGLCAIGAATQGWDQTGSNGANLSFPEEFGLLGSDRGEWIIGLINSIIFLTAGLIGAFIVDPLNKYLGRRGEIFVTAICLTATPIGSACAQSWQGLFAARFIMGIGIGAKNATVPIYSAEIAPHRIRGALVMFWQLWVVIGIFLGFCANVIVKDTGAISWRLQLGSAFIPSFILMVGIFFCPESPRWLMKHGHIAKGYRSMARLRAHPIIAARDYYYSYVIYETELAVARGAGYFDRMWDCFRVPRIRRANYGASTVMIAQQMCGINIISFYSSTFLPRSALPMTRLCTPLWATELFRSSPRFLLCSSSTPRDEGPSACGPSPSCASSYWLAVYPSLTTVVAKLLNSDRSSYSSTSSRSCTRSEKGQSHSSILLRFSLPFSVSREWPGQCASTTPSLESCRSPSLVWCQS